MFGFVKVRLSDIGTIVRGNGLPKVILQIRELAVFIMDKFIQNMARLQHQPFLMFQRNWELSSKKLKTEILFLL